ncbi:MAG: RNase adapter RapZ, partial [Bacteroidales bacterium]|nr:RNase adapter RapZ [Bacteroidales bacterium]
LIRVLQTLGTYAYRGFFEGKHHFIPGMQPAIKNAITLSKKFSAIVNIPYLSALLSEAEQTIRYTFPVTKEQKLTVTINSFSYHRGLPRDYTGHGGGFVFDCRALPNPGREHRFSNLTGKDQPVTEYLAASDEVNNFMTQIEKIVSASVTNYQKRGFRSLQINFGCTGGQHRSVYCAEQLLQRLRHIFPDTGFLINHTNKDNWQC